MIEMEYNNIANLTRAKNYFSYLRIDAFYVNSTDLAIGLWLVFEMVLKMLQQVPFSHCGDAQNV